MSYTQFATAQGLVGTKVAGTQGAMGTPIPGNQGASLPLPCLLLACHRLPAPWLPVPATTNIRSQQGTCSIQSDGSQ